MVECDGQELDVVDNKIKERADVLQHLLLDQLASHVTNPLRNPNAKANKWVFDFTPEMYLGWLP